MLNKLYKRPRFLTFIPGDTMDNFTRLNVRFLPNFWKKQVKICNKSLYPLDSYRAPLDGYRAPLGL